MENFYLFSLPQITMLIQQPARVDSVSSRSVVAGCLPEAENSTRLVNHPGNTKQVQCWLLPCANNGSTLFTFGALASSRLWVLWRDISRQPVKLANEQLLVPLFRHHPGTVLGGFQAVGHCFPLSLLLLCTISTALEFHCNLDKAKRTWQRHKGREKWKKQFEVSLFRRETDGFPVPNSLFNFST